MRFSHRAFFLALSNGGFVSRSYLFVVRKWRKRLFVARIAFFRLVQRYAWMISTFSSYIDTRMCSDLNPTHFYTKIYQCCVFIIFMSIDIYWISTINSINNNDWVKEHNLVKQATFVVLMWFDFDRLFCRVCVCVSAVWISRSIVLSNDCAVIFAPDYRLLLLKRNQIDACFFRIFFSFSWVFG